jgi:hypothetical protein
MELRRDWPENRRFLWSLDYLDDAMGLLEAKVLSGAALPLWLRSPSLNARASALIFPYGLNRFFRKRDSPAFVAHRALHLRLEESRKSLIEISA